MSALFINLVTAIPCYFLVVVVMFIGLLFLATMMMPEGDPGPGAGLFVLVLTPLASIPYAIGLASGYLLLTSRSDPERAEYRVPWKYFLYLNLPVMTVVGCFFYALMAAG
jgi:hypothetical protein